MARERLTVKAIERALAAGIPSGKAHALLWDGAVTGLCLKIRPRSSAWCFIYRPKGAPRGVPSRTLTLGPWPALGLEAARNLAQQRTGEIAHGRDPAAERRRERNRAREVLAGALNEYEAWRQREQYVSTRDVMSVLRRGLAPLMHRELDTLTQRELVDRVESLRDQGKPAAAAELRKHARTFLGWARARGLLQANPLSDYREMRGSRAARIAAQESRGRALSDEEIRKVWQVADSFGAFGGLVRLGLLTAMRRSELAGLCWSDAASDRIVLQKGRTKTGAQHEVPLTPAMRAVLQAQPRHASSDLVFPSHRRLAQMSGWSKMTPRIVGASGVKFALHDLRRTARTLMSRCGVVDADAEIAIGHVRTGLIGLYNKDEAWTRRTKAFQAVSDHIAGLVGGGGAVPLTRKA